MFSEKKQTGFTLLELSITLALSTMAVISVIKIQEAQSRRDNARLVAKSYEELNNAAGSYLTNYYDQLIAKVKLDTKNVKCGILPYQVGGSAGAFTIPTGTNCNISLTSNGNTVEIGNFLQPTPAEFVKLGFLNQSFNGATLPLPTYVSTGTPGMVSVNYANQTAPESFGVLISFYCIGKPQKVAGVACAAGDRLDLSSLVFNLQPYQLVTGGEGSEMLYRVLEAAGSSRAYLSDTQFGGKLRANNGAINPEIDNPLLLSGTSTGAPYILAMSNGYGSAGYDAYLRRDGSTPLTGDWDVGNKGISNISSLTANSGSFAGVTSSTLNSLYASITSLFVPGDLNVDGITKAAKFRLKNEAELGAACTPGNETLVRASGSSSGYSTGLRMLVCDPDTNKWVRAQADYKADIDEIRTAVIKLGGDISAVSAATSSINGRLAKVEDEYMTWDIIKVSWDAAEKLNDTTWQAKSYVWKKTPFQCVNFNSNPDGSGSLPLWAGGDDVRWKQYASDIQKGFAGSSYTPPIFIGLEDTANEPIVYDVNCDTEGGNYWYVAVSAKLSNMANGNRCRDGMTSSIDAPGVFTYTPITDNCVGRNFVKATPSFNKQKMSARFIAFTKKPG